MSRIVRLNASRPDQQLIWGDLCENEKHYRLRRFLSSRRFLRCNPCGCPPSSYAPAVSHVCTDFPTGRLSKTTGPKAPPSNSSISSSPRARPRSKQCPPGNGMWATSVRPPAWWPACGSVRWSSACPTTNPKPTTSGCALTRPCSNTRAPTQNSLKSSVRPRTGKASRFWPPRCPPAITSLSSTLKELGLKDSDVKIMHMEQGQAMAAFGAGQGRHHSALGSRQLHR